MAVFLFIDPIANPKSPDLNSARCRSTFISLLILLNKQKIYACCSAPRAMRAPSAWAAVRCAVAGLFFMALTYTLTYESPPKVTCQPVRPRLLPPGHLIRYAHLLKRVRRRHRDTVQTIASSEIEHSSPPVWSHPIVFRWCDMGCQRPKVSTTPTAVL